MDTLYIMDSYYETTHYTFDNSDDPEVCMQVLDNHYVIDVQHCPCCGEESIFDECGYFDNFDEALAMLIRTTEYNNKIKETRNDYEKYLKSL